MNRAWPLCKGQCKRTISTELRGEVWRLLQGCCPPSLLAHSHRRGKALKGDPSGARAQKRYEGPDLRNLRQLRLHALKRLV